jgi:hypothetical protein
MCRASTLHARPGRRRADRKTFRQKLALRSPKLSGPKPRIPRQPEHHPPISEKPGNNGSNSIARTQHRWRLPPLKNRDQ